MTLQKQQVRHCKQYQDIIDGVVPGVVILFEEQDSEKYQESLKVATSQMTDQEYLEKHSAYYIKNPHLRTIIKD